MKRSLLFLALFASLFLSNCKKDTSSTASTATEVAEAAGYTVTAQNTLNVESLKALSNQDVKRTAFGILLPIEKYLAWIENAKVASANFTPQQKALTLEFINFLSPSVFDKSQAGKVASFRDQWVAKAQKIFTYDQIRNIAYLLFSGTDSDSATTIKINGDEKKQKCNCANGQYWTCDNMSFCPSDYSHGTCLNPSTWGCGFAYYSGCDNLCVYPGGDQTTPSNPD